MAVCPGEPKCFTRECFREILLIFSQACSGLHSRLISARLGSKKGACRRLGFSSFWQKCVGLASCKQYARMTILNEMTWRLSFICIVPCINMASCIKERVIFQCFENIAALKKNLDLNSTVDVWRLVLFSMTENMLCKVLVTAW